MLPLLLEGIILKISEAINKVLSDILAINCGNSIFAKNYSRLHGKIIKINFKTAPAILNNLLGSYYLKFQEDKIVIKNAAWSADWCDKQPPDLVISFSMSGLLNAKFSSLQKAAQDKDFELSGDLNLAIALQSLFTNTEINFKYLLQESLARKTSDQFAWQFINILDGILSRLMLKKSDLSEQIIDYLQIEKNILVSESEVISFCQEVDILRDDVDRLDARVNLLC